jgi:outer membrane receptor protein involved in Fe transport
MTARALPSGWWLVWCLVLCATQPATGQSVDSSTLIQSRQLAAAGWVPARESRVAPLRRTVALDLSKASIESALQAIRRKANLDIVFGDDVLASKAQVTLDVENMTVVEALTQVLDGTGLEAFVSLRGDVVLVRSVPAVRAQTGTIAGVVTDTKSGVGLAGATLVVEGTSRSTTTGNDGRYRISEVAPATYTVRARYIGYAPGSTSLTVSPDQEATADFALEKSVQRLDEVVTTGTVVPTEVKALPTPVSVIRDSDIALQRPHTVQELIRQAVPTAVSWDWSGYPGQLSLSTRGASTFVGGGVQMKVFVDGVDAANPTFTTVDLNSIDHIEVIRGPQAAAIYGSDAIGGVIQIFTKRGDQSLSRPQVDAQGALGAVQTPYSGYGRALRQTYSAAVRGGGSDVSYNFGGGYSRTGNYLPGGDQSALSNPSAYGGMRFARGIIAISASGRYQIQNNPNVNAPEVSATGFSYFSKPLYQAQQIRNETFGTRIDVAPTTWWRNTVTVGVDRTDYDVTQSRPRLTTPADTLLFLYQQADAKTEIGYNTSVQGSFAPNVSASMTVGFDHFSQPSHYFFAFAPSTTGTISTAPENSPGISANLTNNTGYFAQAQLGFQDKLFLTGGLRAEQNTNFGGSIGTPVSPRIGLSYTNQVAGATVKIRGSWGRAIRPPSPQAKAASASPNGVILANPALRPERQRGWDAGIDAVIGRRGSLSFTYYDQTAEDLIQFTQVQAPITFQNQNAGRVTNTGAEVEGTLSIGPAQLKAQYGYARARIEQLATTYTGDQRVGDQVLATPTQTAGASLGVALRTGANLAAGMTYVGSWRQYDYLAEYSCFAGTGPCAATSRDYIVAYPSFVKLNAVVSQPIRRGLSAFLSIDNLANNTSVEYANNTAVFGRITTLGLHVSY